MMHMNNKRTPSSFYGTQWPPVPRYNKTPSKVVSIPVHFVDSSERRRSSNKSESARNIQRVVRGFLVRKSMKKMMTIRVELEEIEKKVNEPKIMDLMRREQRERIRVGETIMNLLLRLNSVRVFHCSALRDLRKSLIKRAIVLQELVDQIQSVGPTTTSPPNQSQSSQVECLEKEEEHEGDNRIEGLVNEVEDGCEGKCVGEQENCLRMENEKHEGGDKMETLINEKEEEGGVRGESLVEEKEDEEGKKMEALVKEEKMDDSVGEENEALMNEKEVDGEEVGGPSLVEGEDEEGEKMEDLGKEETVEDGEGGSVLVEDCMGKEEDECEEEKEESYEGGRDVCENREMLKRMVEDNEKMMDMMAQLFERNEMQTRVLTSLTQRVEQLERAFTCDKLRRKKQKRRNPDAKYRQIDPKKSCN